MVGIHIMSLSHSERLAVVNSVICGRVLVCYLQSGEEKSTPVYNHSQPQELPTGPHPMLLDLILSYQRPKSQLTWSKCVVA